MTRLVGKSLVVFEESSGHGRYRLLESVRQYGPERLDDSGDAEEIAHRHHDWHLRLAEQASVELRGRAQDGWLSRIETERT